jgi:hypothetical protein
VVTGLLFVPFGAEEVGTWPDLPGPVSIASRSRSASSPQSVRASISAVAIVMSPAADLAAFIQRAHAVADRQTGVPEESDERFQRIAP